MYVHIFEDEEIGVGFLLVLSDLYYFVIPKVYMYMYVSLLHRLSWSHLSVISH